MGHHQCHHLSGSFSSLQPFSKTDLSPNKVQKTSCHWRHPSVFLPRWEATSQCISLSRPDDVRRSRLAYRITTYTRENLEESKAEFLANRNRQKCKDSYYRCEHTETPEQGDLDLPTGNMKPHHPMLKGKGYAVAIMMMATTNQTNANPQSRMPTIKPTR